MFDLGSWGEFLIIVVAVLVLIGPKELPTLLKSLGRWTYKAKKTLRAFRKSYDHFLQEGEIEEYIKETNDEIMRVSYKEQEDGDD